jgi:hypothetical protein
MKKIYTILVKISFAIFVIALLTGCASMSTMQTARTVGDGNFELEIGGGAVNTDIALGELDTLSFSAPFIEVGGRYGITDKLDVGAKLTLIGTATADVKYQFLGDQESLGAVSTGLGIGYLSISSGDNESKIFDIAVPLYLSLHPTPWFSLYSCPRYTLRINSYTSDEDSGSSTSHWYGATAGMRLGKKVAFLIEYSYFGNTEIDIPFSQVTGGIAIGF